MTDTATTPPEPTLYADVIDALRAARVTPTVREADADTADAVARTLVDCGLTAFEFRGRGGVAKLFPAHVGGIAYLKSVLSVLPGARIMATGGVSVDDADAWLAAGAFSVSIGSDLTRGDVRANVARLKERTG
ncbi:hypothetical protein ACYBSK_18510 [Streptomyces sp. BYX5S]